MHAGCAGGDIWHDVNSFDHPSMHCVTRGVCVCVCPGFFLKSRMTFFFFLHGHSNRGQREATSLIQMSWYNYWKISFLWADVPSLSSKNSYVCTALCNLVTSTERHIYFQIAVCYDETGSCCETLICLNTFSLKASCETATLNQYLKIYSAKSVLCGNDWSHKTL